MTYTIKKESIDSTMAKLGAVSGKKFIAIKPMNLQGVQHLKIAAHNDKFQIEDYIACESETVASDKTFYVPSKFADICRLVTGNSLSLDVTDSEISIANGKTFIKLPLISDVQLLVSDISETDKPEEHPMNSENTYRYTIDSAMLYAGLSLYGGMNEKNRSDGMQYDFDGIYVEVKPDETMLDITSTEGHAFCTGKIPYNSFEGNACGQVMPAELPKILSSCVNSAEKGTLATVTLQKSFLYVNVGTSLIYFRLKETSFPKVEVIKNIFNLPALCTITVDTKELENAIKLIDFSTDDKEKSNKATPISFLLDGEKLVLKSVTDSSIVELSSTDCTGTGQTVLCYKLLSQLLALMPQKTTLTVHENGTTSFNNYTCLLPIQN